MFTKDYSWYCISLSDCCSCKHTKGSQKKDLQLLVSASVSKSSTPLSLGYHEDSESGDSDSGAELLEDAGTLRDEGVEVIGGGKYAVKMVSAWCHLIKPVPVALNSLPPDDCRGQFCQRLRRWWSVPGVPRLWGRVTSLR